MADVVSEAAELCSVGGKDAKRRGMKDKWETLKMRNSSDQISRLGGKQPVAPSTTGSDLKRHPKGCRNVCSETSALTMRSQSLQSTEQVSLQ